MRRTAECGPAGEEGTKSSSTLATDADQEDSAELSRDSTSSFEENAVEHESNEDISSLSVCELRKALQDAKKKNTDLHENLSTSKKKLKTAARKTKRLEKDLSALTKNLDFLNEDQKAALKRKSRKGSAWSAETIKKALQLKFACGSAGYDLLLEQGNPLPSRRTLCRRLQHLSFKPGVLIDIVNMMKVKVAAMSNIEKDCVIFLDEMEIRKGVELDRSGDGFLGKVTLPETDRAANHVLVFMVGA